jgi:hypothetical protein
MVFGDGRTAHFWEDRWIAGKSVGELAPALAACIPRRIPRSRTVAAGLQGHSSARDIRGTIGIHEIGQYLMLWRELEQTTLTDQPDTLIWKWSTSGRYSASSCYRARFHGSIDCNAWR